MKNIKEILIFSLEDEKIYTLDEQDSIYSKDEIINFFENIMISKIKIDYNYIFVYGNKEKFFIFEVKE